jgi:hypothetical protein
VSSKPFGSPFWNRTHSALTDKLVPNEKIASEIFSSGNCAGGLCCTAKYGAEARPMAANLPFINDFSRISGA